MTDSAREKVVKNPRWALNPEDIIKEIVSFWGLFRRILGDELMIPLLYSPTVEHGVHVLDKIYNFHDARKIFPKRMLKGEFDRVSETVFRVIKPESDNK